MSDITPNPMRIDKEERPISSARPLSRNRRTNSTSSGFLASFSSKKKKICIGLVILILLLLGSFLISKPSSEPNSANDYTAVDPTNSVTDYQTINPPIISREATQSQSVTPSKNRERLEVPGEITDQIEQKIAAINRAATTTQENTRIQFNSPQTKVSGQQSESLLTAQLPNDRYTIQLSASSSLENLLALAKKYQITNYQIYESRRDNKPWFILIKGNYPTSASAKAAIELLPDELKKDKPWIKSGATINKEKQ